ncbi:MAG: helix-turn-helix transcriptional regulator [Clostridia bacterium]|nr:helix-turn-helix transcriptional regulator [Clostridia bacterium]
MKLYKKLYQLRKKSGLSQEELAERLNVSRQAISKWESGAANPESEKLIAISNYFNVSVDYLIKDEIEEPAAPEPATRASKNDLIFRYVGLLFCILGFLCLVAWGTLMIANPGISDSVANSSIITIDGRAVLLIVCSALVTIGVILLLKKQSRR